ncbi:MAG: hypothetical protein U0625_05060 [Phycisphaerales bacterium]
MSTALLMAIATELAALAALLVLALGAVAWARRGRLDPARECVRCGYPRGPDPAAPCTECGLVPAARVRAGALPTRRWIALGFASACVMCAVFVGIIVVRRPALYPFTVNRTSTWSYPMQPAESKIISLRVECQAKGSRMGYELFTVGSTMAQTPVRIGLVAFSVVASDGTVLGILPLVREGEAWRLQFIFPGESSRGLPQPGVAMDDAAVAAWLAARGVAPGPEQAKQTLLRAKWFLTTGGLEERVFGGGPLSGDGQSGLEVPGLLPTGRTGSNFVGAIDPDWSMVREAATLLVALALGSWSLLLAVRAERSRRVMATARR